MSTLFAKIVEILFGFQASEFQASEFQASEFQASEFQASEFQGDHRGLELPSSKLPRFQGELPSSKAWSFQEVTIGAWSFQEVSFRIPSVPDSKAWSFQGLDVTIGAWSFQRLELPRGGINPRITGMTDYSALGTF